MSKLSEAMIEAIPGLKAARDNGNVTFLNLDTDDTNPVMTEGFDDEDVAKMCGDSLRQTVAECNIQEQQLSAMLADVKKRRASMQAILKRQSELMKNGVHNRP